MNTKQQKSDNTETWMKPGQLLTVSGDTYGIKEKCLFHEHMDETIHPLDNVLIPDGTIGMIVGFVGNWHTCMVTVAWGRSLNGQKLVLSEKRLIKATANPGS